MERLSPPFLCVWVCFHLFSTLGCPSSFSPPTSGCWVWQASTDNDGCFWGSVWWSPYRGSLLRPLKHLICSFLNLHFSALISFRFFCAWLWAKCENAATLKSAPGWDSRIPQARLFLSFFPLPFPSLVDLPVLLRRLHSLALAKPPSWQSPWGFGNAEVSLPSKLWHHLWHQHVDQTASYRDTHTYIHTYNIIHTHIYKQSWNTPVAADMRKLLAPDSLSTAALHYNSKTGWIPHYRWK